MARLWCISEVVKAHEGCPELQAILDEYHKPVMIWDRVLGDLMLDKGYAALEGQIRWCGKDVRLSLEVNAESKPSWTRARSAADSGGAAMSQSATVFLLLRRRTLWTAL